MVKYLVLLVFSIPLLWILFNEGQKLFEQPEIPPENAVPEELTNGLDNAENAAVRLRIGDNLQRALVCVAAPVPAAGENPSEEMKKLAAALRARAAKLA